MFQNITAPISVSEPDPFNFVQPDPDPFHETDPERKKSAKIMENFHQNHKNYFRIIDFCLTDINVYLINNKTNHF